MTKPIHRTPVLMAALLVATIAISAPAQEANVITNSIGMKLARIPDGTFVMGSSRSETDRDDKEERHEVTISRPFYIGVYEVTQAEYIDVMTGSANFSNRSTFKSDDNPVENVEWRLAKVFCDRLSSRADERSEGRRYRLPTEAEWEYACRGGSSSAYNVGNDLSSTQANFNGNFPAGNADKGPYLRKTTTIGSYEPNAFGLYDMHGNVAEWCADWYDPDFYLDSPVEDPLGPPFGVIPTDFDNNGTENHWVVIRGGSWVDDARALRSAYRYRAMPNTQYRLIGFRVVCEVETEPK